MKRQNLRPTARQRQRRAIAAGLALLALGAVAIAAGPPWLHTAGGIAAGAGLATALSFWKAPELMERGEYFDGYRAGYNKAQQDDERL